MNHPAPISSNTGSDRDEAELIGKDIAGRFRVEQLVAVGGYGLVYRAQHPSFDRPVAIKVLRMPVGLTKAEQKDFIKSFNDEGKLMFELSSLHAGIAKPIEAGTTECALGPQTPFLVMEWLEGCSLAQLIDEWRAAGTRGLSIHEVLSLLEPVAGALVIAHAQGVAHRDIKPANIIITEVMGTKTAKILDFGIAKVMQDFRSAACAQTARAPDSMASFTPMYAAPEQWVTRLGASGPWSDVFSFALVCAELLCGRRALQGPGPQEFMGECLDEAKRPTPRALGVEVDESIEAIFARAMHVQPSQRYESLGAFWEALTEASADLSSVTARTPLRLSIPDDGSTTVYGAPSLGALGGAFGASTGKRRASRIPVPPARASASLEPRSLALWGGLCLGGLLCMLVLAWIATRGASGEPIEPKRLTASMKSSASAALTPAPSIDLKALKPGQPLELPKKGALTVLCQPFCSRIVIDGKDFGASPLLAEPLEIGPKKVEVERAGHPSMVLRVRIDPGSHHELDVPLTP